MHDCFPAPNTTGKAATDQLGTGKKERKNKECLFVSLSFVFNFWQLPGAPDRDP